MEFVELMVLPPKVTDQVAPIGRPVSLNVTFHPTTERDIVCTTYAPLASVTLAVTPYVPVEVGVQVKELVLAVAHPAGSPVYA